MRGIFALACLLAIGGPAAAQELSLCPTGPAAPCGAGVNVCTQPACLFARPAPLKPCIRTRKIVMQNCGPVDGKKPPYCAATAPDRNPVVFDKFKCPPSEQ